MNLRRLVLFQTMLLATTTHNLDTVLAMKPANFAMST